MKLTLQYHDVRSTRASDSLVEDSLIALLPTLKIDEAIVRLERWTESSPPFRVSVHLVTPGPDVIAEARDHTLNAAINKVIVALRKKIGHRSSKRLRRLRGDPLVTVRHVNPGSSH